MKITALHFFHGGVKLSPSLIIAPSIELAECGRQQLPHSAWMFNGTRPHSEREVGAHLYDALAGGRAGDGTGGGVGQDAVDVADIGVRVGVIYMVE
jgi:hypothetical protein